VNKYAITEEERETHWNYCEANKLPFITLKDCGGDYSEIFIDVTNLPIPLEDLSLKLKEYYFTYLEFLLLDDKIFDNYKDQYYYFLFLVKKEHSSKIGNYVFDYIKEQWLK